MPPNARLESARSHYKAGNFVEASLYFRQVVKSCSCAAGKPNKLCSCRDLVAACEERSLKDALRKPCKCIQRASQRCTEESHIAALSSLVAVATKLGDHDLSLIYAQNLVALSPREPKAYLRLGQSLRLKNQYSAALGAYEEGIVIVGQKRPDHPDLKIIREQVDAVRKQLSKGDPFLVLPREIVVKILDHLTTRQLCRCFRVSKGWKQFLEGSAASAVWSYSQHYDVEPRSGFGANSKKIRPDHMKKLLYTFPGGRLKSLRIDDCRAFGLIGTKFTLMWRMCPQLEHLYLGGQLADFGNLPPPEKLPSLISLYLSPQMRLPRAYLERILKASEGTLEELAVMDYPDASIFNTQMDSMSWSSLPRLHTLRIACNSPKLFVDVEKIMLHTPNVQTVWIDSLVMSRERENPIPEGPLWPHLQRIIMGAESRATPNFVFPSLSESLVELVVENQWILEQWLPDSSELDTTDTPGLAVVQLFETQRAADSATRVVPPFTRLQKLAVKGRYPLSPAAFRALAEPAVKSGTLQHLSLSPFPWAATRSHPRDGNLAAWLKCESLSALAVSGLVGEVGRHVESADQSLIDLVTLFPKLRALDIGSETVAPSTLGRIIETSGGALTLYHQQGASMLNLKTWARSTGADVIHGSLPG